MSKTFTVTNISPFDLMRVGKVPYWIKNNIYLEQSFASGYSNEAKKNKI